MWKTVLPALGIAALCGCLPAWAQFTQYRAPGSQIKAPENEADAAWEGAENARWRLGPIRIDPLLGLRNVGYDENAFASPEGSEQINDSHLTVGGGLVGYLPLGTKMLLSAFVTPEYTWWQDSEELRQLNPNSGLGWFATFNRMTVSARARSTDREQPLAAELEAPVQIAEDSLTLDVAVQIGRRLVLFGEGSTEKLRHSREVEQLVPDLDLRSLDRDDERLVYGIEARGNNLTLGLGIATARIDFVEGIGRASDSDGPMARLSYQSDRLRIDLEYADVTVDFDDARFADSRQTTGTARLALEFGDSGTITVYAGDDLAFAVFSPTGFVERENHGAALSYDLGARLGASVFAEVGKLVFIEGADSGREDDLEAFGLTTRFGLTDTLVLTARLSEESWNSNQPEFDRTSTRIGVGLELRGDLLPW